MHPSLGYRESADTLAIRIDAHKKFSNFSLEQWLEKNLFFAPDAVVLDLGCGAGNFFSIFSQKLGTEGSIIGADQSQELLFQTAQIETRPAKLLLRCDMNRPLPFKDEIFHVVLSFFAIYYAKDLAVVLAQIRRVLREGGRMFLIGPAAGNARELYALNQMVFGMDCSDERVAQRTSRIEEEFYPAARSLFSSVTLEKIRSRLTFPNKEELVKYYKATLLFEESAQRAGFRPQEESLLTLTPPSLEISKEMVVLRGRK